MPFGHDSRVKPAGECEALVLASHGASASLRLPDGSLDQPEAAVVALLAAAATIFFGLFPQPLFDLVNHAGRAFTGLF